MGKRVHDRAIQHGESDHCAYAYICVRLEHRIDVILAYRAPQAQVVDDAGCPRAQAFDGADERAQINLARPGFALDMRCITPIRLANDTRESAPGNVPVMIPGAYTGGFTTRGPMDATKIIAIVLIIAGALGLISGQFSFTKETHEAKIGPLEFSVKEKETFNVPVWLGGGAVALGVALLVVGGRKK